MVFCNEFLIFSHYSFGLFFAFRGSVTKCSILLRLLPPNCADSDSGFDNLTATPYLESFCIKFFGFLFYFSLIICTTVYYGSILRYVFLLINLSWEFYFWWRSKCGRSESDSINTDIYTAFGANSDLLSNPRRDAPPRQFPGYTLKLWILLWIKSIWHITGLIQ